MHAYGIYKHGLLCMYVHIHKYIAMYLHPYIRTYVRMYTFTYPIKGSNCDNTNFVGRKSWSKTSKCL